LVVDGAFLFQEIDQMMPTTLTPEVLARAAATLVREAEEARIDAAAALPAANKDAVQARDKADAAAADLADAERLKADAEAELARVSREAYAMPSLAAALAERLKAIELARVCAVRTVVARERFESRRGSAVALATRATHLAHLARGYDHSTVLAARAIAGHDLERLRRQGTVTAADVRTVQAIVREENLANGAAALLAVAAKLTAADAQ
jgi:hypothetical protein